MAVGPDPAASHAGRGRDADRGGRRRGYGDNRTVRQALHRLRLPCAVGISPNLTVFRGTPTLRLDRQQPPPRNRRDGWPDQAPVGVSTLSEALPTRAWRRVDGAMAPICPGPPTSRRSGSHRPPTGGSAGSPPRCPQWPVSAEAVVEFGARRLAGKARRPSIPGVFEGGATPPAGIPRPRTLLIQPIEATSAVAGRATGPCELPRLRQCPEMSRSSNE